MNQSSKTGASTPEDSRDKGATKPLDYDEATGDRVEKQPEKKRSEQSPQQEHNTEDHG